MRNFYLFVFYIFFCQSVVFAGFEFIPNGGQWHPNVLYKASVPSGALFLEEDGLKYSFYDGAFFYNLHAGEPTGDKLKFHAYKLSFVNPLQPNIKMSYPTEGVINYYLGKDTSKWVSGLKGGQEVLYKNIWEGIDFKIYNRAGDLKYDFIVHPGANPNDIQFEIEGLDKLSLKGGQLFMETSLGTLIDDEPVTYQRGIGVVESRYILEGNKVRFWIGDYDETETLTIDPTLIFSTYSGSEANNFGFTATHDENGYLYAGGSVFNQGYPTTVGAFDVTFNSFAPVDGFGNFSGWYWGVSDIGITKYNLNGTSRLYSTYIGGSLCEVPHSLVVNKRDELFILGTTSSSDYPTSTNAFDNSFGGGSVVNLARGIFVNYTAGSDIVISRLSANGTQLLSSTFVGGAENDGLNVNVDLVANYADQMRGEIILDENENVVVGSSSASNDFPVTINAIQSIYGGGAQDGVVFKMNEDLSTMIWSSFYGGADADGVYSIIESKDSTIYFAGGTKSSDLQMTSSAYQTSFQGGITDGFYAQVNTDGNTLISSSYFGSDRYDQIYFIREDRAGQIYVYGQSDKFGTYWIQNAGYNTPNSGQFISKFQPNELSLEWSTTFGSGDSKINISPTAFMVDLCNKVYLSGWGSPSSGYDRIGGNIADGTQGMEVTSDAFKSTTDNGDFYLMVLEDDASSLVYGSFFGGDLSSEHVDGGTSRFDNKGVMYQSVCAGCGGHDDFPIFPPNVVGPTNNGVFMDFNGNEYDVGCNNGVFKFDFGIPNIIADFRVPPTLCAPANIEFRDNSKVQSNTTWQWDFGDGTFSTDTNPSHTYAVAGTYKITLKISDPTACNLVDSVTREITVMGDNVFDNGIDSVCLNSPLQIGISAYLDTAITYSWTPAVGLSNSSISNPIATVTEARDYTLIIQNNTCADTVRHSVFPLQQPFSFKDTIACVNNMAAVVFEGEGKYSTMAFSSSPLFSDTLNTDLTDSVLRIPIQNNILSVYVRATDELGCVVQDTAIINPVGIAKINGDTTICELDMIWLTDTLLADFVQRYTWSPNQYIIADLGDSLRVEPANSVRYSLIKDYGIGCSDTSIFPLTVSDNIPEKINDTLLCNQSVSLLLSGDNNPVYNTVVWKNSTGDTVSTDRTYNYNDGFGEHTFFLNYTDSFGCDYGDTLIVNNIAFQIQTNADSIICNTNTTSAEVMNYTLSRFDSLIWQPGNEIIGDSSALLVDFLANKDVNQIWVYGLDTNGCEDRDTVIVLNLSIAGQGLKDTTICFGDSINIGVPFDSPAQYDFLWRPGTLVSDSTIPNPKAIINDTTAFTLIVGNGVCVDTLYQTVNVSRVEMTAAGDTTYCNNEGLITAEATTNLGAYVLWSGADDFGDTLLFGIDENRYQFQPSLGANQLYVKAMNSIGCSDIDSVLINRFEFDLQYPAAQSLCSNDTVEIVPQGYLNYDSVAFNWSPLTALVSDVNDTIGVVSPVPGSTTVYIAATAANGCSDLDSVQVLVSSFDTTTVSLSSSADTLIASETALLLATPNNLVYNWTPLSQILSTDSNAALVGIEQNTIIEVMATDPNVPGCSSKAQYSLTFVDAICGPPYIFVPNAFTPNGDGENDVLFVRGRNLTDLYFAVFNRWGEKVFETSDQSVGWDGFYKDNSSDPAVFDYYLKCKCAGGEEYFEKGNITVIR